MVLDAIGCSWGYLCMATFSLEIILHQAEVDIVEVGQLVEFGANDRLVKCSRSVDGVQ